MDVAEVFKAFDLDAEFTFLAGYVVEIDVLDCRREAAVADFSLLVYEIDFEDGLLALADLYVADKDVFDDTAAAGVGLDAYDAVEEGESMMQFSTKRFLKPPEISLPTTTPPWPFCMRQFRTITFCVGMPHVRPSRLRPLLMAMQSSPVSKKQSSMSTFYMTQGRIRHRWGRRSGCGRRVL